MNISVDLLGYQITEDIYVGNRTLVYRGIRESDQQPVVIKLLRNPYPSFHELIQFRHQYIIAKNLDFPTIIATYGLQNYHNSYALIMEDFRGISLQQWMQELSEIPLKDFLQIAIDLCTTLNILYQERIIHKDIKPANILIDLDTKKIKLIDFSIASLLPRETKELQNTNSLEGTLAYLSPEQTGRMNRGIDYRSDFYSLGVTFYELLTGQLPYQSHNPMELVHCHLAKNPISIHEIKPQIPLVLSEIINKLMAKNAENRYQSALGIKHDFELCLEQLQATGQIRDFEIGQRDISDRFLIPEKLYGREQEIQILLEAFDRVASPSENPETTGGSEIILVAGLSGIGKTAVVHEVHKPITKQKGYFIQGKFDQFQRDIPFFAFVQAFRNLIGQLLSESDQQLHNWQQKILKALGENAQILIDLIPELEYIIGKQSPAPELSGSAAKNRFNLLFQKFVQVFTNKEHPLVIFIDDLQWADSASLKLLQLLMQDTRYLLVIGAYRDNEVSPSHPFILTIDEILKTGAMVNTINLQSLNREHLNQLVADTLKSKPFLTQPLTELVYQKTQGNPFFATQFLKALYEDGQISFDIETRSWLYDIFQIQSLAITDDVVEFMASQLQKLSQESQQVLKLAACIGAQFDLQTLAIIYESSPKDTARNLQESLLAGLIIPNTESYKFFMISYGEFVAETEAEITVNPTYRFSHDRIQQAAYSLIPDEQKQSTHLNIGQLLHLNTPEEKLNFHIFDIVNHLNRGVEQIELPDQIYELIKLNLIAAEKAKSSTAYNLGFEYVQLVLRLLEAEKEHYWHSDHQFTLTVYEVATEIAYLIGDFIHVNHWAEQVLLNTHTIWEKIKIYEIMILSKVTQKQLQDAIALGLEVITALGIQIPNPPTNQDLEQERNIISELISTVGISALQDLPMMTDQMANAVLRIANVISVPCYLTSAQLFQLIVLTQVRLSILYGNAPISVIAYARYGIVLCGVMQEIATGYQFGNLALAILDKFNDKDINSRTLLIVGALTLPWKAHLRDGLPLLQAGYEDGLAVGNLEPAALSHYYESQNRYILGEELTDLKSKLAIYSEHIRQINQEVHLNYNEMLCQVVLNLLGESEHPTQIIGTCFNEDEIISSWQENKNAFALYNLYIHKAILCYWFEQFDQSMNNLAIARDYLRGVTSQVVVPLLYFYDALAKLSLYSQCDLTQRVEFLEQIEINQKKLDDWAIHAPMNFQHKLELLIAEKYRILEQRYEAQDYYDRAILGAKENGYIQEEALANELAAKFFFVWGKEKIAASYMQEAYYCYSRWGAKAKINDLEFRYPQLLEPILRQAKVSFNPLETLIDITHTLEQSSTSSTSITDSLDFVSVLKAAQTISSQIKIDELINQLTQIILQNSGADKCVLVLLQEENWQVRAISTLESTEICHTFLDDYLNIPRRLIQYVKRTNSVVKIDNLDTDLPVVGDYLTQHQPKSVLGLPILNQGHLVGVVYLENQATAGVFNGDRLTVINFLCAQAAISLINAQLYQALQRSEAIEHQKATELAQTLAALQLQNKKLAFRADVDTGLTRNDHLVDMLQSTTESIVQHLDAAFARIWTLNPEENILELQASAGQYTHIDGPHARVPVGKFKIGLIAEEGLPHLTNNVLKDPRVGDQEWAKQEGMVAFAGYPLIVEHQVMGVMAMFSRQILDQEILDLLSSVADEIASAIKRKHIQKALQESEVELRQKSQQIQLAFQQLQQTQLQMVQSEKMSALGNLVAGVAHEINNPIGFLSGNIMPALSYINDLFSLLDLYQRKYPQPDPEIQEEIQSLELEYIREDLPKLIDSMKEGVKRIRDISNSLRTFSRADTDRPIKCNVHEGIDSTIMILKHRLKSGQFRPEITVIKNYGNLPLVECYAGQMNQVFMNILANAIDALDESNYGRSFDNIQANPNWITITTSVANTWVNISIADNGKGMSEEIKTQVFNHLFTTKEVGKGTGLGLAIARQIVEEKHGGTIIINSTLGQGTEFVISLPITN